MIFIVTSLPSLKRFLIIEIFWTIFRVGNTETLEKGMVCVCVCVCTKVVECHLLLISDFVLVVVALVKKTLRQGILENCKVINQHLKA